jgi:hypothetical protein
MVLLVIYVASITLEIFCCLLMLLSVTYSSLRSYKPLESAGTTRGAMSLSFWSVPDNREVVSSEEK